LKAPTLLQWRGVASAFVVLFAALGPARGADLTAPTMLSAPSPATLDDFDWTGVHVGIHGGFGVDHFGFKYGVVSPATAFSGTDGITAAGPIGGVQAGITYQFPFTLVLPYKFVAGLEFDASWSGIGGETTAVSAAPAGQGSAAFGSKFSSFGTGRLRLGYALGRFFPYITGGFTYGIIETYGSAGTNGGFFVAGSRTVLRSGILPHVGSFGIGVEYAMTPSWTVKAEYLYEFVNARRVEFQSPDGTTFGFGTRTMYHVGRVGLNYRFDWSQAAAVLK